MRWSFSFLPRKEVPLRSRHFSFGFRRLCAYGPPLRRIPGLPASCFPSISLEDEGPLCLLSSLFFQPFSAFPPGTRGHECRTDPPSLLRFFPPPRLPPRPVDPRFSSAPLFGSSFLPTRGVGPVTSFSVPSFFPWVVWFFFSGIRCQPDRLMFFLGPDFGSARPFFTKVHVCQR